MCASLNPTAICAASNPAITCALGMGSDCILAMTPAELKAVSLVRAMAARGELKAARTERHLTRSEVAAGVETDPSTVYRWETGESTPRAVHALRWARLMDLINASELVA